MNFPEELTNVPAWITWRLEDKGGPKLDKIPYDPRNGQNASPSDPKTWTTYHEAVNGNSHNYTGPGFVLSDNDEFTCIDLDDPYARIQAGKEVRITPEDGHLWAEAQDVERSHRMIVEAFQSYTEWSPSGRGLHIWIKGKLPAGWGSRKGKVEIYSRLRFMTMTGNRLVEFPNEIREAQGTLELLATRMGLHEKGASNYESQPQTREDIAVYNSAAQAKTGEAFVKLYGGNIEGYPSASEADLALANYICFFTENYEQAERIFRASGHYAQRAKLHGRPELVTYAITKGFDRKPPPIDMAGLHRQADAVRAAWAQEGAPAPEISHTPAALMVRPPGLLGDIAGFLFDAAPRPVAECALAGAIGLLAGITGRAFNISATGLNQYVVLIGESGVGKESASSGINRLMRHLTDTVPAASMFVGPSNIQSAPGLYKMFGDQGVSGVTPSFVSLMPEFGKWLSVHTDDRANPNAELLARAFLDLWVKSGRGEYAGGFKYSDAGKDMPRVLAPGFSIIGDTVPGKFYAACTADAIEGGLIPRMLLIEYKGQRPPLNEGAMFAQPDAGLIGRLKALCEVALMHNQRNDPCDVGTMADATELFRAFDKECDRLWNASGNSVAKALWNRSHLKSLKLAALCAVGCNFMQPIITVEMAAWAIEFVKRDAHMLLDRFEKGEVSSGSVGDDRHRAILRHFRNYITRTTALPAGDKIPEALQRAGIMPFRYLMKKLKMNSVFRDTHIRSCQQHAEQAIKEMQAQGLVREILGHEKELQEAGLGGSNAKYYALTDASVLERINE